MKKFYVSAWVLLAAAVFMSLINGTFNAVMMLVFSLIALALVHMLMVWSVIVNAQDAQAELIIKK